MAPTLSSFINPSSYAKEVISGSFVAAMKVGTGYVAPTLTSTGSSNDPGGLFGWLIYARSNTAYFNPAKGTTSDRYIVYNNPGDLVGDLNKLSGITNTLLSNAGGGLSAFFSSTDSSTVVPTTTGYDFLHSVSYLAYGGSLILAPFTSGFDTYQSNAGQYLDVVINKNGDPSVTQWVRDQTYTMGIHPTIAPTGGLTGEGFTAADYQGIMGAASYVTGSSGKRIFTVYGTKTQATANTTNGSSTFDIGSLLTNGTLSYTLSTVSDVAGFFARAKSRNETYLTVAGLDRSIPLNGTINNTIDWSSTTKTELRNKRINFFVNYTPRFLGSDLVGATSSSSVIVDDRVGPARMKIGLTNDLNRIGIKYSFEINNDATRSAVNSEIESALEQYATFIDATRTQIICDSTNNTDNSSQLNISLIVKPILSVDSFVIDLSFTQ
jgi:hypothetical protein